MRVFVGIDLSGPSNAADTACAWFAEDGAALRFVDAALGASDADLLRIVAALRADGHELVVGIDAPLSYNDGGGQRPSDASLRARITKIGMRSGSVMPPTFQRMAYLTLRGLGVARALVATATSSAPPERWIVEVHPGATFGLHGAPIDAVLGYASETGDRRALLRWLPSIGVHGAPASLESASHSVAACGAALGAWKWANAASAWRHAAAPPHHPFDFAC